MSEAQAVSIPTATGPTGTAPRTGGSFESGPLGPTGRDWIVLGAVALVIAPAFVALHGEWSQREYYGHGYFVPLVAAWAATAHREALGRIPARRDSRGLVALVLAVAVYGLGLLMSSAGLQGLAVVIAVTGALWWQRGLAWVRKLSFGLGYLLFMVPIPEPWIAPVIVSLQTFVTWLSVGVLQAAGMTVARNGNVIDIPGGESLFVAEACSGITSLVTLLPIAAIVAYFSEGKLWRRLLLIASVVPLALLGNGLRVIATVTTAAYWGADVATKGPLHDYTGLLTYALGCLALLAVASAMRRFMPDPSSAPPTANS